MKRILSKIFIIIFMIIITMLLINTKVYAAGIGISTSKSSAYVGDSVTVTISGIYGAVNITGSGNLALSASGSQFVDGSLSLTATANSAGTGVITVTPTDAVTTGENPVEVTAAASTSIIVSTKPAASQPTTTATSKSVTSTTSSSSSTNTKTKKDDFYITKLALKGIKENGEKVDIALSPKFSKKVYEYTCTASSDIQKLELEKSAGDYSKNIKVSGLEELKEGENTITVKLSKEGQTTRTYKIKVTKETNKVEDIKDQEKEDAQSEEEQNIENKEPIMISMPLTAFIVIQLGIIVLEVIIIGFVFRFAQRK